MEIYECERGGGIMEKSSFLYLITTFLLAN